MKVSASRESEKFKPVTVAIVLESDEQVQMFYSLFNYRVIADVLRRHTLSADAIRAAIREVYPDILFVSSQFEELKDAVKNAYPREV